jgi:hypothetical protein
MKRNVRVILWSLSHFNTGGVILPLNRLLNRQSEKIDPSATDEVDRKSPYFKKGSTPTSIQDIVHDRRSGKRWNS